MLVNGSRKQSEESSFEVAEVDMKKGSPTTTKPYRHFLNLEQKIAVIDIIDKARRRGCSNMVVQMRRVASCFGISPSTAYHIYQKRDSTRAVYSQKMQQKEASSGLSHHQQRNFLPLKEKLRIVEMIEERRATGRRVSFKEIGQLFGVSTSCAFSTYMKRATLWQQFNARNNSQRDSIEASDTESEDGYAQDTRSSFAKEKSMPSNTPDDCGKSPTASSTRPAGSPNVLAYSIDSLLGLTEVQCVKREDEESSHLKLAFVTGQPPLLHSPRTSPEAPALIEAFSVPSLSAFTAFRFRCFQT